MKTYKATLRDATGTTWLDIGHQAGEGHAKMSSASDTEITIFYDSDEDLRPIYDALRPLFEKDGKEEPEKTYCVTWNLSGIFCEKTGLTKLGAERIRGDLVRASNVDGAGHLFTEIEMSEEEDAPNG